MSKQRAAQAFAKTTFEFLVDHAGEMTDHEAAATFEFIDWHRGGDAAEQFAAARLAAEQAVAA